MNINLIIKWMWYIHIQVKVVRNHCAIIKYLTYFCLKYFGFHDEQLVKKLHLDKKNGNLWRQESNHSSLKNARGTGSV